jgi:membrane protease YdiL (CAAX protease family)
VEGVVLGLLIGERNARLGVDGLLLDVTMLAFLVPLYRRRQFTARALGLRSTPPAPAVGWVLLSMLLIGAINAAWLQGVVNLRHASTLGIALHGNAFGLVLVGAFVCVSAPLVEEVFFRGLLYRALRNRLSVPVAALIAGALFGLVHGLAFPLDTLPPRIAFGVIACLLYERTGSLWPGIALHCLIDAGGFEKSISGHTSIVWITFLILAATTLLYAWIRSTKRPTIEPAVTEPRPTG